MSNGTLNHDDITRMLVTQIDEGIAKINEANAVLLAEEESGTSLRDIDKALKENKHENADVSKAWEKAEKAREAYKKLVTEARNLYRTQVLGEDEVSTSSDDVDKDAVKEVRKMVMEAVGFLKTYATANGKTDIVKYVDSLAIPQVGRQGVSNVGQKKPRAYVSVDGTVHESFGEAAKALSVLLTEGDNKVTISSGDLVQAWSANGEKDEFEFQGHAIKVTAKEKKAAA